MYNWEKCLLDVWFPVSVCVADVLLNPGHAGQGLLHCTRHRMQCEECLGILQMSVLVGSLPPVPALLLPTPQWSRAQGVSQSTALVQSYTGGNCCQSSDSFSALGTLLLDNRVANAHTQHFLFRPEGEKCWRSCVVMPYQPSTAMWCCDPLLALEASLGK